MFCKNDLKVKTSAVFLVTNIDSIQGKQIDFVELNLQNVQWVSRLTVKTINENRK